MINIILTVLIGLPMGVIVAIATALGEMAASNSVDGAGNRERELKNKRPEVIFYVKRDA